MLNFSESIAKKIVGSDDPFCSMRYLPAIRLPSDVVHGSRLFIATMLRRLTHSESDV